MLEADTFFSPQKLGLKMLIAVLVFSSQLHMTYSSPCSSDAAAAWQLDSPTSSAISLSFKPRWSIELNTDALLSDRLLCAAAAAAAVPLLLRLWNEWLHVLLERRLTFSKIGSKITALG